MLMAFTAFDGVYPKVDPLYLGENAAQQAENCRFQTGGAVEPYKGLATAVASISGSNSIYRFGRATASSTQYWFASNDDNDYCPGLIAGDAAERTFYTSSGHEPRYTMLPGATSGGGPFPTSYYKLGVPKPASAPSLSKSGAPDDPEAVGELMFYCFTYVTSDGQESAPSLPSAGMQWSPGETITVTHASGFPAGNYNFGSGKVRVYRSQGGTAGADFYFAAEISLATLNTGWADGVLLLGEPIPTEGWTPPDAALIGLTAMPNGVLAAFKDQDVWFSHPFAPYAWPAEYIHTVDLPIVGLGAFGSSLAVLTIGEPHVLSGADPVLMSAVKLSDQQACVSKRSIRTVGNAVLYASPDGLVSISDAGLELVTAEHFSKREWAALNPASMVGASHDGLYIAFYDNGSSSGGIVFDPRNRAVATTSVHATASFSDTVNNELFLAKSNAIYKWDAGVPLTMRWKSKVRVKPRPSSFAWAQVVADSYPVQLEVWADGSLLEWNRASPPSTVLAVPSRQPFRLPATHGRGWEVRITGTQRVQAVYLADSSQELANV